MTKIWLCLDRLLQGSFELNALNLVFVFQVNCPGCFIYGFPLVNQFYWQYRDRGLNVLGLSTAFEDFEFNTAEHTQLLLNEQKTVGVTRKVLGETYDQTIDFPVAIDRLTTGTDLATLENIAFLCEKTRDFDSLSNVEKDMLHQKVKAHIQRTSQTSATFFLNQLPGTPTFLLVNENLQLLAGWFGHTPEAEVVDILERHIHLSVVNKEVM